MNQDENQQKDNINQPEQNQNANAGNTDTQINQSSGGNPEQVIPENLEKENKPLSAYQEASRPEIKNNSQGSAYSQASVPPVPAESAYSQTFGQSQAEKAAPSANVMGSEAVAVSSDTKEGRIPVWFVVVFVLTVIVFFVVTGLLLFRYFQGANGSNSAVMEETVQIPSPTLLPADTPTPTQTEDNVIDSLMNMEKDSTVLSINKDLEATDIEFLDDLEKAVNGL